MKKFFSTLFILFSLYSVVFGGDSSFNESVDSGNRLRLMTYEDEFFIPEIKNQDTVLINKAGKNVNRGFYDKLERLVKNEIWEIADVRNSKIVSTELFEYEGDSNLVSKKTVFSDSSEEITLFNEKGFPVQVSVYHLKNKETQGDENPEKERILFSKENRTYDEEDRILSEEFVSEKKSEMKKYSYHEDKEIPPDFENIQNGRTLKKVLYTSKNYYSEEVFFDSGYSVKSYFEEGTRKKDEYFQNGKLLRSKIYE